MSRPVLRLSGLLVIIASLSGCSSLEPWVKPYERAALADEIMSDRNPTITGYVNHTHEVREAASGATGAAGGGCGCL
jgi:Domain of unknown function (DUF4266)